jgi:putative ABC transport system permease protein
MAGSRISYRSHLSTVSAAIGAVLVDVYLSLTARPMRSSAMVAGIVVGVAAAVSANLIADTQQERVNRRFDAMRSQYVVIQANGDTSAGFPAKAVAEVAGLGPVSAAGEFSIWRDSVSVSTNRYTQAEGVPLIGATTAGLRASGTRSVSGMPASGVDRVSPDSIVWLGSALAERLRIRMDLPQTVTIADRPYTVAGIVQNDGAFGYVNSSLIIPPDLAQTRWGPGNTVRFVAHVRPGSAGAVAEYALVALDPTRKRLLANATPPDSQALLGHVASDLRRIGLALGFFVGLIGMIAVANTLSMSVTQRTRELGLRAAMGWTRRRIGGLVLVESAVAGLLAAIIGCALGMTVAFIWCGIQGWQLIVSPTLAPLIIFLGTLSSVIGGLIPAYRAAAISPLEAMRS